MEGNDERNFTSTAKSVGEKQGGTQAGNPAHRVPQRHARAAPQDRRAEGDLLLKPLHRSRVAQNGLSYLGYRNGSILPGAVSQ
jgi:hypothetical protein